MISEIPFFSQIQNMEQELQWSDTVRSLLEDHKDVVTHLAEGFSECRKFVTVSYCFA